jgi:predicted tellurium resistance membrane protein TerC
MEGIFTFENLLKFTTLSGLEIVLGIDNVIFIAIVIYNIPKPRRAKIRFFGITLAIALRILMLFGVSWIMGLTTTLFTLFHQPFSGRSVLLLAGGLFLLVKSAVELLDLSKVRHAGVDDEGAEKYTKSQDLKIIAQIIFIDLILSFDSVIVAVGMVRELYLIIPAILIAMVVMLVSAKAIGDFMHSNPSIKVLGLAFVLLIGISLILSGVGIDVPKGYLYTAMLFSLFVEVLNIKIRKLHNPKNLRQKKDQ